MRSNSIVLASFVIWRLATVNLRDPGRTRMREVRVRRNRRHPFECLPIVEG